MIEALSLSTNIEFKSNYIENKYLPGMKKLFLDYLAGKRPAMDYYRYNFNKTRDYQELAENLKNREFPRQKVADILWKQNSELGCTDKIKNNIDKFADPRSVAVIAGQQVGIFGGPLYTYYKAAGVIKLAEKLSTDLACPVVPMFWMATEDHDYKEANTANVVNRQMEPAEIYNEPHDGQLGRSMSQITFGDSIEDAVDELRECLIDTEFSEPLFNLLRDFYKPGEKISAAFGRWMTSMFCGYGMVLVDPSDPQFKELAMPVYEKEIKRLSDDNAPDESSNDDRLLRDGYHLQVQKFKKGLNLFYSDPFRKRILFDDDKNKFAFEDSECELTSDDLLKLLRDDPVKFSSGALLRPLVQSKLIPTITFLAGPAEISYHAQLEPFFDYFDVEPPVIRPRPSASLVGKRVKKVLDKYDIDLQELFQNHHDVISNVMLKHFPADLNGRLDHLQAVVLDLLNSVEPALENFDEGLKRTFETSTNRIDAELNKLKGKIFQAHKKKNSEITDQIIRAYDSFFPGGVMQERVLPMIYFLNKYSPAFANSLYEELDIDNFNHQIIHIIP